MKERQPSLFGDELSADSGEAAEAAEAPPSDAPAAAGGGVGRHKDDGPLRRLMDDNFLQYASYVIRDRAIPYLEDGLKPVQRRILFSLHENDDGRFIKVANIVGHAMQYHPHGDVAIGDALVALANKRYLIEGQGNFGNVLTGDPAAAFRYIECRLTPLAREELFNDDLTAYVPSYDGRRKEPVFLPVKLPLLLMLGADGIAVGLSTRILPHNFAELLQAEIAVLQKKKFELFPDFQQGGKMEVSDYQKGNGRVRVRASFEMRGDDRLVIRDIPFGTTTDSVIASIEDAARKKKIKIKTIQDFTAGQIEIEIALAPDQKRDTCIQALYAFTQCEVSLSVRATVIRDHRPVDLDVEAILRENVEQLLARLKAELRWKIDRLEAEWHRKTLVQLFVEHRIYKRIEECETADAVQTAVLDGLAPFREQLTRDVTKDDVEMLLSIPIKRISRFDIEKNKAELDQIVNDLDEAEKNIASLVPFAIRYLKNLLKTYGGLWPRRTEITSFGAVEMRALTARELTVRIDREKGYLGYEVEGETLFECSSYDKLVLLWKDGRYKSIAPPDKLFVDLNLEYAAVVDRDKVMTAVYRHDALTFMKKFSFGGMILNKEYLLAPEGSQLLFFADNQPAQLFVKFVKQPRLKILQQIFPTDRLAVRGAGSKGVQMTSKRIRSIGSSKPRNWEDAPDQPAGFLMDF